MIIFVFSLSWITLMFFVNMTWATFFMGMASLVLG